ncbi:MAG: PorT family protein [Tannerellaceae bacterium]|nr:PorT family protein [Tannerellaceae bacterium]
MKKIVEVIWVALMLLIAIPANAQINFGMKGGVNISSVQFNKDIVSSSNITGFQIGPMIEIMAPYLGVGIDAAVLYSQKGMKDVDGQEENLTTDYIDVPLNFKWKFGLPLLKGYLAAGPYVGFRIGGDRIWNIPGRVNSQIETKSFAAGLNFGLGVEVISHLQVGFNYGLGLTNNYSGVDGNETFEGKHRGWTISAAILF